MYFLHGVRICLLVIVIVGCVDSVEDPVSPGWATLPVKHIPRPDFVLKKVTGSVTKFVWLNDITFILQYVSKVETRIKLCFHN